MRGENLPPLNRRPTCDVTAAAYWLMPLTGHVDASNRAGGCLCGIDFDGMTLAEWISL